MGMVAQLANYSTDGSALAGPLCPLLRVGIPFTWTEDHEKAFEAVKEALSSLPILSTFDPKAETVLQTVASRKNGLGFGLLQKQDCQLKLLMASSRLLTDTESRYATIEIEMCSVIHAMRKCKNFLKGLPHYTLIVDHKPLVKIIDKYSLDAAENPWLQRMKKKLAPFVFTTVWRKGKRARDFWRIIPRPVNNPRTIKSAKRMQITSEYW